MLQHFKVSTVTNPEPAWTSLLNGTSASKLESESPPTSDSQSQPAKTSSQSQETPKRTTLSTLQAFNNTGALTHRGQTLQADVGTPRSPQPARPKAHTIGKDVKFGKLVHANPRMDNLFFVNFSLRIIIYQSVCLSDCLESTRC